MSREDAESHNQEGFRKSKQSWLTQFSLLYKSAMSAILNKLSDLTCKDSILRHALAQGLFKLTSLVKIPIFDSELEITSYYSTVLTIIKRGLFVITTLDSRLRKFSAQSGGYVSGMRFSKSSAEPEGY